MYYIKWYPFLFCFLSTWSFQAQDNLITYVQPQAAINYKVSGSYSHNFSVGHRVYLLKNEDFIFESRQLDMVHFSKFALRDNQSLAMGIQYRFRDIFGGSSDEVRLMQQFNLTQRPFVVRFGHRFRTEQRFTNGPTIHRIRYRFALDFPLKGEALNIGEPYFIGGVEPVWSLAKTSLPQYDARISGQLGWWLKDGLRGQLGMEYRMENFTAVVPQHVFFLLASIQLSL